LSCWRVRCFAARRRRTVSTRLFSVPAGFAYRKKLGRREYLRASLKHEGDAVVAVKYPSDAPDIFALHAYPAQPR